MSQRSRPSLPWSIFGIIVLIVAFNRWMSSQIEHPTPVVSQAPVEPMVEPVSEPATPLVPMQVPPQTVQEETTPTNAGAPVTKNEPKAGENVLEPIYEAPKNDVILVN